jgi:Malectin domain/Bacterial Ig-like domain/IPT/TIG domain/Glucose / Sorbosone dehydrogenase
MRARSVLLLVVFLLAIVAEGFAMLASTKAVHAATPISFYRKNNVFQFTTAGDHPTTLAFGPDGRLYAGTVDGRIYALTLDANRNVTASQVYLSIYNTPNTNDDNSPAAGVVGRTVTGITFDPNSTAANPIMYVSNSDPRMVFNNNTGANLVNTHSGTITRLKGPNFDDPANRLDVVTGLPKSRANHQIEGLHFGPDGWIYMGVGASGNLGAPSNFFDYLPEYCTSASIVRANVRSITATLDESAGSTATGPCNMSPNPGLFEVYATGFRNTYDLLWHTNGKLYANVNGSNNSLGTTPGPADGCPNGQALDPPNQPDLLYLVTQGIYGGYPNPVRGQCVYSDGSLYSPAKTPDPNYRPPLATYGPYNNGGVSVDGMTQYTYGAMAGDIISATYSGDNLIRYASLNPDGSLISINTMSDVGAFNNPIGIATDAQGAIYVAEFATNSGTPAISELLPPNLVPLSVTGVSPANGSTAGGDAVTIYGTSFQTGATVTFGGIPATSVNVLSVTAIAATTPAHASGTVDVVVTNPDGKTATLSGGFSFVTPGTFAPIQVNAGGSAYSAGPGNNWDADRNFAGGNTFSTNAAILGTGDQPLYQSERSAINGGGFSYSFAAPDGAYTVTLKFAEVYWNAAGQRVFNVALNGQPVLTNFDILSVTSPNTALDKSFGVSVTGGSINLSFTTVRDNAEINAIQITSGAPPPTVVSTNPGSGAKGVSVASNITATFSSPMDPASTQAAFSLSPAAAGTFSWDNTSSVMTFSPSTSLSGTTSFTATIGTGARSAAGTAMAAPYSWSFTSGVAGQPVLTLINPNFGPPAGSNSITLNGSGFQNGATVTFGGTAALSVLFSDSSTLTVTVPAHSAATVDVTVTNPNGLVSTMTGGYSYTAGPIAPIRIHSGGGSYTDRSGNLWSADNAFSGGTTYAVGGAIAATPDQALYQTERFGNFSYSFSVPDGGYTVTLKMAELYWTAPGQRVFNVNINGKPALTKFDILSQTSRMTALDVPLDTYVVNGTLTISFVSVVDNAKVGAIEIMPLTVTGVNPPAGSALGGNTVTITGTGFVQGDTVTFGGAAATNGQATAGSTSVTVNSPTSITAVVPAHLISHVHPVDVTVINTAGGSFDLVNGYRYLYPVPGINYLSPAAAAVGGPTFTLTVNGFSFVNSVSTVMWNGAALSTTYINQTQLTASVPSADIASSGTAVVKVVNTPAGGTSNAVLFTVNGSGALPAVTNVNPATGPSAGGTAVVLTGTGFTGATAVSFGTVPAAGFTVSSDTSITATAPANPGGSVDLTVTTPQGTSTAVPADLYTYVAPPPFTPIRVRAGGGSYTDSAGNVWAADNGFSGGGTYSITGAIAGTSDQPLYQTERTGQNVGTFSYTFAVPNGTYTITLKFAELYWTSAGQRVFNVSANGQALLSNFDILTLTSPKTALDRSFVVNVTSGVINLAFSSIQDNAKVNAIQITAGGTVAPAPAVSAINPTSGASAGGTSITITGSNFSAGAAVTLGGAGATGVTVTSPTSITATTAAHAAGAVDVVVTNADGQSGKLAGGYTYTSAPPTFPIRIHAGGGAYTDSAGNLWSADNGFTGGGTFSSTAPIAGTADQALYQTQRNQNFTYSFSVPDGTYTVTLKFAELWWTSAGQRTFNVTLNGQALLTNFDILSETAPKTALDKAFVVSVTGGTLTLAFNRVTDQAEVNAIMIASGGTAQPAPTVTGISPNTGAPAGGASVTISGTNFVSGAAVTLAGTPATNVVVNSPTSITAITPAHLAGTADVVVINPNELRGTLTAGFRYLAPPFSTIRINAGGGAYTDKAGNAWSADTGSSGGGTFSTSASIAGTVDPALYQSERYGNMGYSFSVPDGTYTITLKFAEIYWTSAGQRVFNASVNGQALLTNFDILAETAPKTALDKTFVVNITGGTLNLTFTSVKDAAKISALQVVAGGTVTAAPTVTAINPTSGTSAGGTAVTITGTNFGAGAAVTIGGVPATGVVVNSTTSITAITGPHAVGAVDVVVINPDEQRAALTQGYNYA